MRGLGAGVIIIRRAVGGVGDLGVPINKLYGIGIAYE